MQPNLSDPKERGRINGAKTRGETKGTAKLTESAVRLIRSSPEPSPVIARQLNISERQVRGIRQRLWWKHVA